MAMKGLKIEFKHKLIKYLVNSKIVKCTAHRQPDPQVI